jgi:hypothetical protein
VKPSFHGRKWLALLLGPISALVLAGALNSSFASAEPYAPQTTTPIAALGTGAEVPVPPWCAWHSSIPENVLLSAVDDPFGIITYRGEIVDLAFSSDWNYTYVSGEVGRTTKARSNNCSWFGAPAYGSRLDVEINSDSFTAYIVNGGTMTADPAMNFNLTAFNPITLSRNLDPACDDDGNSFSSGGLTTNLYQSSTPSVGLTVVPGASTLTNNFCKWKVDYAVKIPAGLEPTYTRADYAWIGPQLIYTLSFPVE